MNAWNQMQWKGKAALPQLLVSELMETLIAINPRLYFHLCIGLDAVARWKDQQVMGKALPKYHHQLQPNQTMFHVRQR